jgi:hypothetical protein
MEETDMSDVDKMVDQVMKRMDELTRKFISEYNHADTAARRKLAGDDYQPHPTGRTGERLRMRAFCQALVEILPSLDEQRSHVEAHREIEERLNAAQPRPEPGSRFVVEYVDE